MFKFWLRLSFPTVPLSFPTAFCHSQFDWESTHYYFYLYFYIKVWIPTFVGMTSGGNIIPDLLSLPTASCYPRTSPVIPIPDQVEDDITWLGILLWFPINILILMYGFPLSWKWQGENNDKERMWKWQGENIVWKFIGNYLLIIFNLSLIFNL